jgi:CRP/FNR family transcriptional regulator, anaerobic regulatory protein
MDKASVLDKFSFYREASPTLSEAIYSSADHASFARGAVLYHEGTHSDHFLLVGTGDIRVFKSEEAGNEITLYHVQDGEPCLVNMLCVFLDRPTMATAIVETATEGVAIPAVTFRHWVHTESVVRTFVFETMATRLVDVMVLAEQLAFRHVDERLVALLLERFENRHRPLRVLFTTHDELARELGSAREVVSRLLKGMEASGAIAIRRGQIELVDELALRQLAR